MARSSPVSRLAVWVVHGPPAQTVTVGLRFGGFRSASSDFSDRCHDFPTLEADVMSQSPHFKRGAGTPPARRCRRPQKSSFIRRRRAKTCASSASAIPSAGASAAGRRKGFVARSTSSVAGAQGMRASAMADRRSCSAALSGSTDGAKGAVARAIVVPRTDQRVAGQGVQPRQAVPHHRGVALEQAAAAQGHQAVGGEGHRAVRKMKRHVAHGMARHVDHVDGFAQNLQRLSGRDADVQRRQAMRIGGGPDDPAPVAATISGTASMWSSW